MASSPPSIRRQVGEISATFGESRGQGLTVGRWCPLAAPCFPSLLASSTVFWNVVEALSSPCTVLYPGGSLALPGTRALGAFDAFQGSGDPGVVRT